MAIAGAIKEIRPDCFSTSAVPLHCPFNCIHNRTKYLTHKPSLTRSRGPKPDEQAYAQIFLHPPVLFTLMVNVQLELIV